MKIFSSRARAGAMIVCALSAGAAWALSSAIESSGTKISQAASNSPRSEAVRPTGEFSGHEILADAIAAAASPAETESTTATATSLVTAGVYAGGMPAEFASFDFAGGTRYPEQATASVGPAFYRPGSTIAYVPVTLDRPSPNTVIARLTTEDGTGLVRGVAGVNYQSIYKSVIFRPGDPLTKTVSVPIILGIPQADFTVRFVEAPWGAKMGTDRAYVQCDFLHEPTAEQIEGREPRTFQPSGTLQWKMSRETMKWSDAGHVHRQDAEPPRILARILADFDVRLAARDRHL